MRAVLSLAALLTVTTVACTAHSDAPIGFGARTTGGAGGHVCQWRDESSLRACVTGDAPVVAQAVGNPTVVLSQSIEPGANKTILGPATLTGFPYLIAIRNKSNVAVRHISFTTAPGGTNADGKPCPDVTRPAGLEPRDTVGCGGGILVVARTVDVNRIWIDHSQFTRCGDKCIAMSAVTGTQAAPNRLAATAQLPKMDEATISNNTFSHSFFGVLVGVSGSEEVPQAPGQERVTVYGNTFDHIYRRSPRAAFGAWVHVWNNRIIAWDDASDCGDRDTGFGASVNGGAELLSQGNYYDAGNPSLPAACRVAISSTDAAKHGIDSGPGRFADVGSVFVNGAITSRPNARGAVFTPPYPTQ